MQSSHQRRIVFPACSVGIGPCVEPSFHLRQIAFLNRSHKPYCFHTKLLLAPLPAGFSLWLGRFMLWNTLFSDDMKAESLYERLHTAHAAIRIRPGIELKSPQIIGDQVAIHQIVLPVLES